MLRYSADKKQIPADDLPSQRETERRPEDERVRREKRQRDGAKGQEHATGDEGTSQRRRKQARGSLELDGVGAAQTEQLQRQDHKLRAGHSRTRDSQMAR